MTTTREYFVAVVDPSGSGSNPPLLLGFLGPNPGQLVVVATLLKLRLVRGYGIHEHLPVGGYLTQPLVYAKGDILENPWWVVATGVHIQRFVSWLSIWLEYFFFQIQCNIKKIDLFQANL